MKAIHLAVLAAALFGTAAPARAQGAGPAQPMTGRTINVRDVCQHLNFYESLKVTVPLLLKLDERQTKSWKNVEGALTDAKKPVETGCGKLNTIPATGAATSQAARLEVVLSSSLDALRRVRPSFERFYATLSAGQRRQIDKLFENSPL